MQRMHVGLKVSNIDEAVAFYSKLFGAEPDLVRSDVDAGRSVRELQRDVLDFGLQQLEQRIDEASLLREDQNDLVCGYQLQHKSGRIRPYCSDMPHAGNETSASP